MSVSYFQVKNLLSLFFIVQFGMKLELSVSRRLITRKTGTYSWENNFLSKEYEHLFDKTSPAMSNQALA